MFKKIKYIIKNKTYQAKHYFEVKFCKKFYSDYEDNEYNIGSLKFIWGIKSYDDLSSGENANLYTMNDIDITYDRKTKLYMLGIETAYMFNGNRKEGECEYLRGLLASFSKFMDDNGYAKDYDKCLFMTQPPTILSSAENIEELYINFKIYVEGYCRVYGY